LESFSKKINYICEVVAQEHRILKKNSTAQTGSQLGKMQSNNSNLEFKNSSILSNNALLRTKEMNIYSCAQHLFLAEKSAALSLVFRFKAVIDIGSSFLCVKQIQIQNELNSLVIFVLNSIKR